MHCTQTNFFYGNCMHMSGTKTDWRTEREQQLPGHLHWCDQ